MVETIYLMKKMIITNQKKSRKLLMEATYYMKAEEMVMVDYQLMNILT